MNSWEITGRNTDTESSITKNARMPGNSIGKNFVVTSFGESHGPCIGCIVDGCPPGLKLEESMIQHELDRRKPGTSRHTSQRKEPDEVEILSGVFEGITTGAPVGLCIRNVDHRSRDYTDIAKKFRPGHADYTYLKKYGIRDYRGGGRASARETAARVAAGAIAKRYLSTKYGLEIRAYLAQIGKITIENKDSSASEANHFFCPDPEQVEPIEHYIEEIRKQGDSLGARIHVVASSVPPGWGEPVFDRLDADIAHAMMSINAVKAVGIGSGFKAAFERGSEHRDEMTGQGFCSNSCGGVLGGISTGQNIEADVVFKPTSSILIPGRTVDEDGQACDIITKGRHDPCVGIRAVPIVEAMLAIVLIDHCLRDRAQIGERNASRK